MQPGHDTLKLASDVLGYLNFSSGPPTPAFSATSTACWLGGGKKDKESRSGTSRRRAADGAGRVSRPLRGLPANRSGRGGPDAGLRSLLPAYRQFHRDLLFHQTDEALFQPFFLGRACEAVLQQGGPWDQADRIVAEAIAS